MADEMTEGCMNARSLMAIAAHCDDVELNFGATMLKYHEDHA